MYNVPASYQSGGLEMAKAYSFLGNKTMAKKYLNAMLTNSHQYLQWYCSLEGNRFVQSQQDCLMHFYIMQMCMDVAYMVDQNWTEKWNATLHSDMQLYSGKGGRLPQQNDEEEM